MNYLVEWLIYYAQWRDRARFSTDTLTRHSRGCAIGDPTNVTMRPIRRRRRDKPRARRGLLLVVIPAVVVGLIWLAALAIDRVENEDRADADQVSALTEKSPAGGCPLSDRLTTISGMQSTPYKNREAPDGSFDARTASWIGAGDYPIRIDGAAEICWEGGLVEGRYPDTDSWERLHDTAAFSIESENFRLFGIRIHNYGDGINIVDDADRFVIRGAHLSYIRDDCVENDKLHSGVLEDSFLDGCYTALSARRHPGDTASDGRGDRWMVRGSLIRLQPMPTVYKGPAPGHGRFFKWDNEGLGPELSLHDNVFRADQPPQDGDLSVPMEYLGSCSGNTMVWLGEGEFPGELPDCFTITRDISVWEVAVASWMNREG